MVFGLLLWFGIQPAKSLRYACSLVCVYICVCVCIKGKDFMQTIIYRMYI